MPEESGRGDHQTVWVRPKSRGEATILHTDPECSRIQSEMFERDRSVYPDDTPVCEWCRGEVEQDNSGMDLNETRRTLLDMSPDDLGLTPLGERGATADE